jgi:hypothetical protein
MKLLKVRRSDAKLVEPKDIKELKKMAMKINHKKFSDLNDAELFIYIITMTVNHGRGLKESIDNAKIQIKNPGKARSLFAPKK